MAKKPTSRNVRRQELQIERIRGLGFIVTWERGHSPHAIASYSVTEPAEGGYVGNVEYAHSLIIDKGIDPELADDASLVCSVGKCGKTGEWYGWSHRAIKAFETRAEAVDFADSVA